MFNPILPTRSDTVAWSNLYGSAISLALAEAAETYNGIIVIVLEDQHNLQIIEEETKYFLSQKSALPVYQFPGWECLAYETLSPHEDIISERLRILSLLPLMKRGVILVQTTNLIQCLPPTDFVYKHTFSIIKKQKVSYNALRQKLVDSNYLSVSQVVVPGEFALRGGLMDVFPMGADLPFRLDFFDDEVDSIRMFDPDTQRSLYQVNNLEILPAKEFPMTGQSINQFRAAFRRNFEGDPKSQYIYNEVSQGGTPAGIEFYMPLFFEETATLFDYLPPSTIFVVTDKLEHSLLTTRSEIDDRYENYCHDITRRVLPPDSLYMSATQTLEKIKCFGQIQLCLSTSKSTWSAPCIPNKQFPVNSRSEKPFQELINHIRHSDHRILILLETHGRTDIIDSILTSNNIRPARVTHFDDFFEPGVSSIGLTTGPLDRGFQAPSLQFELICEGQLYGERVYQRRRRSRVSRDPESIIKSLAELHINDPVVHIDHGVGRYKGLQQMDILGEETEYLIIEYLEKDKLYIPILSLNLISRFIGGSPDNAPLHRLGGKEWNKAKKKAQERTHDVATELLEIEALRLANKGSAYNIDEDEYNKFVNEFPFEETPDQMHAIAEVLQDLESSSPMDRLICGDVGFGKTEIALRASFIVAHGGRQVAILAPTTLLAQQHFQSFVDRFADWAVTIDVLSRFKTAKQNKELIKRIAAGRVDIIIGTHRLLQKDIVFANLGLVIIDEEHRFGVQQKEKLKQFRKQEDILTLTATPIPRTLNFAMAGMRSISIIATPPANRLSIKTFVQNWDPTLVKEACLREIRRGGQVYFLHNEVRTIEKAARRLEELIPDAKVNIGHGQMPEIQLERVMIDFYHQRFNILVCTTIIESGIDIPTANTIIMNRADRFGMAQLHQLRGRVGRSHHQAFAYLLIPEQHLITKNATKRLEAIQSMDNLGAGFALASHDLEIRGAGELLGETQSGLIDNVGYSLYSEYLTMAINSIRKGHIPNYNPNQHPDKETSVDLHVPALFPENYLPNAHDRLILYKRIANSSNLEELEELQIEIIDRFGLLPPPGKNLFRITAIRMDAETLDIKKIDISDTGGVIEFYDAPVIDMQTISRFIMSSPDTYRLVWPNSLGVLKGWEDSTERIEKVEEILNMLELSKKESTH